MGGLLTRRKAIQDSLARALGVAGIVLGTVGISQPVASTGVTTIPNLPNGVMLLDKSDETTIQQYFSTTPQNHDLTTDTSFNVGEELLVTADMGFDGIANAICKTTVNFIVEG